MFPARPGVGWGWGWGCRLRVRQEPRARDTGLLARWARVLQECPPLPSPGKEQSQGLGVKTRLPPTLRSPLAPVPRQLLRAGGAHVLCHLGRQQGLQRGDHLPGHAARAPPLCGHGGAQQGEPAAPPRCLPVPVVRTGARPPACPGLCTPALSTLPPGPVASRSFRDAQGPVPQSG